MNRGKEGRRGKKERGKVRATYCKKKERRKGERRRYICTMYVRATMYVRQSLPGRLAENSGHVGPCETF